MLNLSALLIAVAGLAIAMAEVKAAPTNKCVVNGTVTYQQGPCASEQVRKHPTVQELNAGEKLGRAGAPTAATDKATPAAAPKASSGFTCDGRLYCSQMKSCAEAKYFLANCPGVKMDGDKNGIPCEKQWCSR